MGLSLARAESMTGPSPVRPGNRQFVLVQAATVRLGHLIFQTKRWNEAIRMADLKGAVAITMRVLFGRTTLRRLRFEARRMSRSVRIFRTGEAEILRRTVAATVIWLSFRRCRRFRHSFVIS